MVNPSERTRFAWQVAAAIPGGVTGVVIAVMEDLPLRLLLLMGAFGAVVASLLGALLFFLLSYLHGAPIRRRERRAPPR